MENCALYARVSDKYNQEDNTSLDCQMQAGREYARAQGWCIVAEARETMSGTFVLARPRFNELLEMANQNKITRIVVDIPDRLGRGDAIAQCEMLAKMQGCVIAYATTRFDDSTIEGFVQKSTDQLVSGIELRNIARRTTKGRRAWARNGRVIAGGRRPYGYEFVSERDERGRKTSCRLGVVPDEAEIVKQIFEWFVNDGLTPYGIAKRLSEMAIPTLTDKEPNRQKQTGRGNWARSTIHCMLKNETYTGVWHYGKHIVKEHDGVGGVTRTSTRRDKDNPDRIAVTVPAIVERELWDAAQIRLAENRRKGHKPTKHTYLLRGMMTCIHDGCIMTGFTSGGPKSATSYYRCRRNYPDYHDLRCHSKMIRQDKADALVWGYISEILLDRDGLLAGIEKRQEETLKARWALSANLAALEAMDNGDNQKLASLLDLYLDKGITKDVYLAKKAKIDEAQDRRAREMADLQARLAAMGEPSAEDKQEIEALRQELVEKLGTAALEDKRRILERLHVKCIWSDETGELTCSGLFASVTLSVNSSSHVQYYTFSHTFRL